MSQSVIQGEQKRALIEESKLNKIINDSKQRRSRATRDQPRQVENQQQVVQQQNKVQADKARMFKSPPQQIKKQQQKQEPQQNEVQETRLRKKSSEKIQTTKSEGRVSRQSVEAGINHSQIQHQRPNQIQITDHQSQHSVQTPYSNNSLTQVAKQNDKNFNSTVISQNRDKSQKQHSKKQSISGAIDYIEMNKQLIEQQRKAPEPVPQAQRMKIMDTSYGDLYKQQAKSKVNTNLRSKSVYGQRKNRISEAPQQAKYRLDLSPEERIKDDLQRKINDQVKEGIKDLVQSRYADLERMLNENMEAVNAPSEVNKNRPMTQMHDNNQSNYQLEEQSQIFNLEHAQAIDQELDNEDNYRTQGSIQAKPNKIEIKSKAAMQKTPTHAVRKRIPVNSQLQADLQQMKTPKSRPKPVLQQKRVSNPTTANKEKSTVKRNQDHHQTIVVTQQSSTIESIQPLNVTKIQRKKPAKVENSYTPNKISEKIPDQKPQQNTQKKPTVVPRLNLNQGSNTKSQKSLNSKQNTKPSKQEAKTQNQSVIDRVHTIEVFENTKNTEPDYKEDYIQLRTISRPTLTRDFDLKTKEDYLNFSIEKIWQEMEEIGRNKQASTEFFKEFQNQYYDIKQASFYDQNECSPTKRLISMKNAVTKHHQIQSKKGINDGEYSLQYTTSPEKSYIVKPSAGIIDYNNFNQKKAHKLVEKIINGKVERIEIQEKGSPKKSKTITEKSPVRITKEFCARHNMIGISPDSSVIVEDNITKNQYSINKRPSDVYQQQENDDSSSYDNIQIKLQTRNDIDDDDYGDSQIINISQNGGKQILIEGRR
ncbi:UNKNOWN [Stylonychia lemnae]|uniref:Uncharacterized protein n=1 Tax=Stylonychia lemnae TaxID=5949 RepID=A0A077ZVJ1_STYLE|nr:UNKNOWN [Stylonychia lemnae]|eukprot:CDW72446.1 UNKNOWN [Stylonychia lemnae]